MTIRTRLYLHEEIILLALEDRKGTVSSGSLHNFAVGGAVLAELLLERRIVVDESGKKKFARVADRTPIGEPLLDDCLAKIASAKRRTQLQTWVAKFADMKNLKHRIAKRLADRGILRIEEDRVLGIFSRKVYPQVDPGPERESIARLRAAIFGDGGAVGPKTVILLSLANSADLLKSLFPKRELKARKARIEKVINGEMTGKAAKEAIQAMQAAVMVACIMPAIIAATASSH